MKDLKDSYPVILADYAILNDIDDEAAFAWWITFIVKKRKAIVKRSSPNIGSGRTSMISGPHGQLRRPRRLMTRRMTHVGWILYDSR